MKEAPEFYAVRVLGIPHPPVVTKADSAVGAIKQACQRDLPVPPAGAMVIAWRLSTPTGEAYLVERPPIEVRPA